MAMNRSFGVPGLCFKFDIPPKCRGMVPSTHVADGKGIDAAVYIVDKVTGKRALLCEGSEIQVDFCPGDEVLYFLQEKDNFSCFDASTFFCCRYPLSQNYGPFVSMEPEIHPESSPPVLQVNVLWHYVPKVGTAIVKALEEDEILTFLEKCLKWE